MDYKTLTTNFERELLFQIIYKMRQQKLTKKGARKVAKAFLPTLTSADAQEFIEKNARLCEFYPEILEAFITTIKQYDEEQKFQNLKQVREEMEGTCPSKVLTKGGEEHGRN
jgi:hypothetical protein